MAKTLKPGDFTDLAENYSKYRPDYSVSVLKALIGLCDKEPAQLDFVDIGAGTGIWTRMVYSLGFKSVGGIEPNKNMLEYAKTDSLGYHIAWSNTSAEETGLRDASTDLITMASSFHWADFDNALKEFHRVLRPNGRFAALWNPRVLEENSILIEIEEYLLELKKDIKRVSSGRSGITNDLTERLSDSPYFEDVLYMENKHVITMSPERYLGIWASVNDIQVQLGEEKFVIFLKFVESRIKGLKEINATYLTRLWSAKRKD